MVDTNPARALSVVTRIEAMCDFLENPAIITAIEGVVPVTMPRAPGALGFDIPLWVGLGTVGLWAALDAFAERAGLPYSKCSICGRNCVAQRLAAFDIQSGDVQALKELDDLRHLYAHNYAGEADKEYFSLSRHILKPNVSAQLTCGATFSGRASLGISNLREYSCSVRRVLESAQRDLEK
jgi:hypothetical protein